MRLPEAAPRWPPPAAGEVEALLHYRRATRRTGTRVQRRWRAGWPACAEIPILTSWRILPVRLIKWQLSAAVVFILFGACSKPGPPYSVKDALKTFQIEPGFRIEPYIAEPD